VEREPTSTPLYKRSQPFLLFEPWNNIACVADKKVGGGNCLDVRIVLEDPHAYAIVLGEQLQELEPGKIDIVILATGDKYTIEPIAGLVCHD